MLTLKCTKFDFGWGCASDRWGSLQRSLAVFKGATSKGREGKKDGREGQKRGNK